MADRTVKEILSDLTSQLHTVPSSLEVLIAQGRENLVRRHQLDLENQQLRNMIGRLSAQCRSQERRGDALMRQVGQLLNERIAKQRQEQMRGFRRSPMEPTH